MMFKSLAVVAAASTLAAAQNSSQSICDKYTTALLTDNNATTQYTLLTLLVNTAVVGNFTPAPTGSKVKVTGIVNEGILNSTGETVNLLPYFDGGLSSTNRNGEATAVNFLDDGGAAPLILGMPANGTSSNQYMLLTHLYSFFGALLGCSQYGMGDFPSYGGVTSQYSVHRFMALTDSEMNYFIQEVANAAASFGVSTDDITTVGTALNNAFNQRCTPAAAILPDAEAELQAMCTDSSCPLADDAMCSAYDAVLAPQVANETLADGQGVSSAVTLIASGASTPVSGASTATSGTMTGSSSRTTGSSTTGGSASTSAGTGGATAVATTSAPNAAMATAAPMGAVLAAAGLLLAL